MKRWHVAAAAVGGFVLGTLAQTRYMLESVTVAEYQQAKLRYEQAEREARREQMHE